MAESYRLEVLKRLTALLEGIVPITDVHDFTLADVVFRGRTNYGDSDPLPMLSILEATRPELGTYAGMNDDTRSTKWPIIIQGWVENDHTNPSDPAYALMAAVELQLAKIKATDRNGDPIDEASYMLGSSVDRPRFITSFTYGPGVVSPPREQVSSKAFFFLPAWIGLAETASQPYLAV